MNFTVRNHYVPQWYQHRFFDASANQSLLFYLDLTPELISLPGGRSKPRTALRRLGPANCFKEDHLYTLTFGEYATDVIERRFFGKIDQNGESALKFFANYTYSDKAHTAFPALCDFMAAQLFRTPKGLKLLQQLAGTKDHQATLISMQHNWQLYQTIWAEAVWEVFNCRKSPTKFILTDAPVTTYNPAIFPGSEEVKSYGIARMERIGTRVFFPLDREHCLCLTNLQYVRNPKVDPKKFRENPRYFGQGMFDLRKIQRGRDINESEVIAINHILKCSAQRYIAASKEEWLYPEKSLYQKFWPKIIDRYALGPDPRKTSFTTGTLAGGGSGGSFGTNEYGHFQLDNPRAEKLRKIEWTTFQAAKQAWDERDRRLGKQPPADIRDYW